MGLQLRNVAAWRAPPAGRLQYIRIGGVWKPILDMWVMGNPAAGSVATPPNTFLDPFDNVSAWTGGASVAGGRTGNGFQATSNSIAQGGAMHTIPVAQRSDTVTVGFAFKVTSLTGDNNVLSFYGDAGTTLHTSVNLGNDRSILAWRGFSSLIGNTSPNNYPAAGPWFYVEVQVKLHDTAGVVIVRINGAVVLNLTNVDTKNAGTGTVIDTVQLASGHPFNSGIVDDFYLVPGATFLGDTNASSPPSNPPVSTDHTWHKEPTYSAPALVAPTNLRMYNPDPNAHYSFQVAWDWSQPTNGLPVGDFEVVLTNSGGGWLQDVSVAAGSRTYNFTGLSQTTQYMAYVRARYPGGGRAESAWAGPIHWATGTDAYSYQTDILGWQPEYEWNPGVPIWWSSVDPNSSYVYATDGNFSSYWWSAPERYPGTPTGYQGEGLRFGFPGGQHLLTGIDYWPLGYPTLWYGVYVNGSGWQTGPGPQPAYNGYAPLMHPYMGANSLTGGSPALRAGQFDTSPGGVVDILMQAPNADNHYGMIELRLVLRDWGKVGSNTVNVAAVNSAAW